MRALVEELAAANATLNEILRQKVKMANREKTGDKIIYDEAGVTAGGPDDPAFKLDIKKTSMELGLGHLDLNDKRPEQPKKEFKPWQRGRGRGFYGGRGMRSMRVMKGRGGMIGKGSMM